MPVILPVEGVSPEIHDSCFVADNATIVGDVVIGRNSSLWFNCVVRGDVNKIRIGDEVNIQDGAVIHCTYKLSETHIGNRVSIGHNAIIHGCTIEPNVLIGMGAIVMDLAHIPEFCVIGAGSLVPAGKKLDSGYIYVGSPARKLRKLSEEDIEKMIIGTAGNYQKYSSWFEK